MDYFDVETELQDKTQKIRELLDILDENGVDDVDMLQRVIYRLNRFEYQLKKAMGRTNGRSYRSRRH